MERNNGSFRNFFKRIDFYLLIPVFFLIAISLSTLFSINPVFFRQQLVALLISIIFFILFTRIDLEILSLSSRFIYFGVIIALILILIFGIEVNSARSWFDFFGVRIQVSEIVKPLYLIILATFLASNLNNKIYKFLGSLALVVPIFFLIYKQPDLGTGVIYLTATFMVIFLAGFPKKYIIISALIALSLVPLLFLTLADYQKQRIMTFFDLTSDPTGTSYNAIQSLISIGSGGFVGKGFGQGTQSLLRFLPEQHTDFIFATISEDLGFVGSVAILVLFAILLYRIYKIAQQTKSKYQYFLASGVFSIFFFQILFNVGMNLGLMPIIGITLPFVSYGGSSLLSSFIALGILSNLSTEIKKKQSMEIG